MKHDKIGARYTSTRASGRRGVGCALALAAGLASCQPEGASPEAAADGGERGAAELATGAGERGEGGEAIAARARGIGPVEEKPTVLQIASGTTHTCAVLKGGELRCWGSNFSGELGDGTVSPPRATPAPVLQSPGGAPLVGVQAVALGAKHSCALLRVGEVRCWGNNESGQLGDGTTTKRVTPVPVLQSPGGAPLTGVAALSLGFGHTCALMVAGDVRCWGSNGVGQLGDGTTTKRLTPVSLLQAPGGAPLTGVRAMEVGSSHGCVLVDKGEVRCWGSNDHGKLGDGTTIGRLTPVPVLQSPGGPPLAGARTLSAADVSSCVLLGDDSVQCWGGNWDCQLGDGTASDRTTPVPVLRSPDGAPLAGVRAMANNGGHGCAHFGDGTLACWGKNFAGQVGDGTNVSRSTAVPVLQAPAGPPLANVVTMALGARQTCALERSGDVACWGENWYAQLGDGTTIDRSTPVRVQF